MSNLSSLEAPAVVTVMGLHCAAGSQVYHDRERGAAGRAKLVTWER